MKNETLLPKKAFAGADKNKLGPAAHLKGNMKRAAKQGDLVGEGVIVSHDATDPIIAILGGAGTLPLSTLKKKAKREAKQLAEDVANDEFKNSAYNIKQLANTLNTLVAALDEMEKGYFGEAKQRLDPKCWDGYRKSGTKTKGGVRVNNCVKVKEEWEIELEEMVRILKK